MYMNDITLFTKKKKELETQMQTIRIYNQDMEFSKEKCTMLIMRSGKRQITEGI